MTRRGRDATETAPRDSRYPVDRRGFLAALGVGSLGSTAGCAGLGGSAADRPGVAGETLTLTTTTSTYDTGLLDAIHPDFEAMFGVTVDAVAQGTGAALETARNGDADVVMVHARALEDEFLRNGYGVNRRDLMFNDFVIVGPPSDPAGIEGSAAATEALAAIAQSGATFVSRGDNSGTHATELELWAAAPADPGGDWYQEAGTGMGNTLTIADQQDAYTLADRGTFIAQRDQRDLVVLLQGPMQGGPERLANPYGIIAVNPARHETVNYDLAMAYIGWLTGPDAQAAIGNFEANGQQLFFPEAVSAEPDFQQYVPAGWQPDSAAG